jgi:hypothetical protein
MPAADLTHLQKCSFCDDTALVVTSSQCMSDSLAMSQGVRSRSKLLAKSFLSQAYCAEAGHTEFDWVQNYPCDTVQARRLQMPALAGL